MKDKIVIIAEKRQEKIHSVTLECIEAANKISSNGEIIVLLFGDDDDEPIIDELMYYHADRIVFMKNSKFARNNVETLLPHIQQFIEAEQPFVVLLGQTDIGKTLAACLSENLDFPLISNIVEAEQANDNLTVSRQIFSGNIINKVQINNSCILSVKQKAWRPSHKLDDKKGRKEVHHPDVKEPGFSLVRLEKKSNGKEELSNAHVIAAAGRGVENERGYNLVKQLAETLGGKVGVSRGAVELGVCDATNQIGQTGETVAPKIYIACGISGAIQHLVGITSADMIIAINKDVEAPIFQAADYGIVGDVFDVLPLLEKELGYTPNSQ